MIVLLSCREPNPAEGHLFSLVKAVEWFARHTNASVIILTPQPLIGHPELASVYDLTFKKNACSTIRALPAAPNCEHKSAVWPVTGKPHPFSPGEQLLAEHLTQDRELSGLFLFNQRVETLRGNAYQVDLLWPSARFVIEVDGYQFHHHRDAFLNDRHRDYELMISGYKTLRLDHEEVISDVGLCIEKIRDVVHFIKNTIHEERV